MFPLFVYSPCLPVTTSPTLPQAGIVSWGIGCGTESPSVYASVATASCWVDQQVGRQTVLMSTCVNVISVPCPLSPVATVKTVLVSPCAVVCSVPCPYHWDCSVVQICRCIHYLLSSTSRLSSCLHLQMSPLSSPWRLSCCQHVRMATLSPVLTTETVILSACANVSSVPGPHYQDYPHVQMYPLSPVLTIASVLLSTCLGVLPQPHLFRWLTTTASGTLTSASSGASVTRANPPSARWRPHHLYLQVSYSSQQNGPVLP